jgi:PAS domain S-box-containing protein
MSRATSEILQINKELVLQHWENRAREYLPGAKVADSLSLRDSLPKFMDELIHAIGKPYQKNILRKHEKELALEHGTERSQMKEYDLSQVIEEYKLLRQVIFEILRKQVELSEDEQDIIMDSIQIGVRNASLEFIRRRKFESFKTSENLRLTLDGVKDHAIIQTDESGYIVSWNTGAEKILGWTRDEVLGTSGHQMFTPEDLSHNIPQLEMDTARTAGKVENSSWHVRKDGSRFFASGTMNTLRDESGNVLGFIKVLRDQTYEKLNTELLAKNQKVISTDKENFYQLFRQIPEFVCVTSGPQHIFEFVNEAHRKILGFDATGKPFRQAQPESQEVFEMLDRVYRIGEVSIQREIGVTIASSFRYFNFTLSPRRDVDGNINGVMFLGSEVSDVVSARKVLEKSEKEFKELADSMPQNVWAANATGDIFYFNKRFLDYTGANAEDVKVMRWKDYIHPDDVEKINRIWNKSFQTGEPYISEYRLRSNSNEYRWHLSRAVPIRNENNEIIKWYGTNTDIDDQKIIEQSLMEERELRDKFVTTITHDLRTPLTAAKISSQLLLRKANDPEAIQKISIRITENIDRGDKMIRDILDANRVKAGEKLHLEVSECNLNDIAEETLEELSSIHGDRFILMATEQIQGYWNASGIRRILENLCTNAIKYGASDRPITISFKYKNQGVQICVHNFGPPIPKEDQKLLFEPFKRTSAAEAGNQKGWGIGLSLVRGIVTSHGGAVRVESSEKEGTSFYINIPIDAREVN